MTEYIVFQCTKCHQYTYAKLSQKGKKCPRCGRNHVVAELVGEIVEGPTNAMQLVKQHQNSNYRLGNFTSTKKSVKFTSQKAEPKDFMLVISEETQLNKLVSRIIEWQKNEHISSQQGFPEYILDYIAKEIEPNQTQRNNLIRKLYRLEKITRLSSENVFVEE